MVSDRECGSKKVRHAHLTFNTSAQYGIDGTFYAAFVDALIRDAPNVYNAWARLRLHLRSSRVVWSGTSRSRATLRHLRTVRCSASPNRQPYAIFGSPCFFPGQHATYFPFSCWARPWSEPQVAKIIKSLETKPRRTRMATKAASRSSRRIPSPAAVVQGAESAPGPHRRRWHRPPHRSPRQRQPLCQSPRQLQLQRQSPRRLQRPGQRPRSRLYLLQHPRHVRLPLRPRHPRRRQLRRRQRLRSKRASRPSIGRISSPSQDSACGPCA
ncbi:MAG: hypothetical protein RL385_252 [Pseudomonadota bacterium]|jgi:hypothetical protein